MWTHLKSAKKVTSAYLFKKRYPLTVSHIITTRCNLRCNYCNMWKNIEGDMTTEQVFRMLDEFSKMGLRRYGITGGEPLLREDIGHVVSYAKKKGCIVTLFTNGVLLEERIDELKDLDVLITSLDGSKDSHDKNRQKGSYDSTIDAIKLAREKGFPVWVGLTLTKHNLDDVSDLIEMSKKMGFSILVQPIYIYPGYSASKEQINDMSEFGEKYKGVVDLIIKKKKQGYLILDSFTYLKHMKDPHDQSANKPCWASKTFCAVTPSGNISPCFKIYNRREWPNGVKVGFKKAFESIPTDFKCTGCFSYATTESNLFYSLNPEVIYNTYFKMIKHEK